MLIKDCWNPETEKNRQMLSVTGFRLLLLFTSCLIHFLACLGYMMEFNENYPESESYDKCCSKKSGFMGCTMRVPSLVFGLIDLECQGHQRL